MIEVQINCSSTYDLNLFESEARRRGLATDLVPVPKNDKTWRFEPDRVLHILARDAHDLSAVFDAVGFKGG